MRLVSLILILVTALSVSICAAQDGSLIEHNLPAPKAASPDLRRNEDSMQNEGKGDGESHILEPRWDGQWPAAVMERYQMLLSKAATNSLDDREKQLFDQLHSRWLARKEHSYDLLEKEGQAKPAEYPKVDGSLVQKALPSPERDNPLSSNNPPKVVPLSGSNAHVDTELRQPYRYVVEDPPKSSDVGLLKTSDKLKSKSSKISELAPWAVGGSVLGGLWVLAYPQKHSSFNTCGTVVKPCRVPGFHGQGQATNALIYGRQY